MRLLWLLPLALLAAVTFVSDAGARSTPAAAGKLSPRLAEIVRSPGLRAARPARQSRGVGLPSSGPGSLGHRGERLTVAVRVGGDAGAVAARLRAAGVTVLEVSDRYGMVTAAAGPGGLDAMNRVAGVRSVKELLAPMVFASGERPTTAVSNCQGAVASEGDGQMRANDVRNSLGVDGAGIKVGVLSDSFDRDPEPTSAASDAASGDLPGGFCGGDPVQVLDDGETQDPTDEGRAMLQIVHDLAPAADLAFASATANGDPLRFANNIRALRDAGARVIVDDVSYYNEPFFQDGPIANAVNEVAADGVAYFSSAGNSNQVAGNGSWESPAFRGTGACPTLIDPRPQPPPPPTDCEDFDPGPDVDTQFRITVPHGGQLLVDLQWAEPWGGVQTDIDAYLVDAGGNILFASEDDNPGGTQEPFEFVGWDNDTGSTEDVFLVINRFQSTGTPRLKFIMFDNGFPIDSETYATTGGDVMGPTIFGHNGAAGAQSVGAIHYSDSDQPEPYSSHGPVTLLFGPVGSTPAAPLPAPRVLAKPDVTATDCVITTFFSGPSKRFCGTSAAAPHAAAVAALQLSGTPSASAAEALAAQRAGADPIGSFGPLAVGAGKLDAVDAALPPELTFESTPPALSNERFPMFAFRANRQASFTCALDGAVVPCGSPFRPTTGLPDGTHTFAVTATDPLGHSRTSAPVSFAVDGTPPETVISSGPGSLTNDATPALAFSSVDPGARFECRFDAAPFAPCNGSSTPVSRLSQGRHSFEARAIDLAGNADPTPAQRAFTVDTVKPTVRIRKRPARVTRSQRARFTFAASERVARYECRVDRKRFTRCRSSRRVRVKIGRHRMQVRAVDRAQNRGRTVTFRWRVTR